MSRRPVTRHQGLSTGKARMRGSVRDWISPSPPMKRRDPDPMEGPPMYVSLGVVLLIIAIVLLLRIL